MIVAWPWGFVILIFFLLNIDSGCLLPKTCFVDFDNN